MNRFKGITHLIILFIPVFNLAGCGGNSGNSPSKAIADVKSTLAFENLTNELGLAHVYRNGEELNEYTYLEAMGGGLAVLDYDHDGFEDLFFPGGGTFEQLHPRSLPNALSRNHAGMSFEDVSNPSGIHLSRFYTQGVACGDFDNDGFSDLVVTGFGGMQFFVNRGDGTFEEIANKCGLDETEWSSSVAFADLDNDGNLDLYVAHYVDWSPANHPICKSREGKQEICPPAAFQALNDSIKWNRGDGQFDESATTGLQVGGKGLGVLCADFNKDNQVDIYVANDTTNNFLYSNRGDRNFEEVGVESGVALDDQGKSNGSMGIAVLDYDNNQSLDLWVCNYEDETFALYKNDGDSNFRYVSSSTGVTVIGNLFVAFGVVASDFDHDGDEDVVVANGHVLRHPSDNSVAQYPLLIENLGTNRFQRKAFEPSSYFGQKWRGRGVVRFDLENDGDLDVAFSNVNEKAAVLENRSKQSGASFILELIGTTSNRDGIGSTIVLSTNKRELLRTVYGGGSYMSQSSYAVHFGVPFGEGVNHVEILWPSGRKQRLNVASTERKLIVVEPR